MRGLRKIGELRRFISIAGLTLVLLVGGCSQALSSAEKPTPTGLPQATWSTRPIRFIGVGDSVTAGFGATEGHAYFDQLAHSDLPAVFPNFEFTNYAVSGTISSQHLEKQIPKIPTFAPDVYGWVVITSGGNDLIHNYGRTPPSEGAMYGATLEQAQPWIKNYETRLTAMLNRINKRFPGGCDIFVGNIYDPTDGRGDIENAGMSLPPWRDGLSLVKAYNQVIQRVVDSQPNYHLVDINGTFTGHGIHHGDQPYWYYANLEDPNDLGYAALEKLFWQKMEQAANERRL